MTPKMTIKAKFLNAAPYLIMMIPGIAYLLVNNYLPMAGLIIAFKNMNFSTGIFGGEWVGFKNFEYLFKTTDAYIITRNTILYNAAFIVINTTVSVLLAILLNEIRKTFFTKFYQSVVLLPHLISVIIIAYLVFGLLSMQTGFVNKSLLPFLGMDPVSWYTEPERWPFILIFVNAWRSCGFLCVVYLASVIGIDKEYYEAATIDGASKIRQIVSITLPLIKPTIILMVLLAIGRIFYTDFGLFYQVPLNTGAIYSTTNVVDTYVYRSFLQLGDVNMSSAAGLYQSVVGFVLVLLSNLLVRKFSKENALF
jgi:putative aldouronate transport system permease protein